MPPDLETFLAFASDAAASARDLGELTVRYFELEAAVMKAHYLGQSAAEQLEELKAMPEQLLALQGCLNTRFASLPDLRQKATEALYPIEPE